MGKICRVSLGDETFHANCGDLLLDSAILNGIELPHDCRSGICGTCRVRLIEGKVFDGTEAGSNMIYACQARIVSDLQLDTEAVPEQVSISARVVNLVRLASDVMGIDVELTTPLRYLPGQYFNMQFRGFPARSYSPTYPLEGGDSGDHLLHFHVRIYPSGIVSSALGRSICVGHRVNLTGPFGDAYLRPNHSHGLVLVASGTGFAPMWSIAVAAILERPQRELIFVVSARTIQSLYMCSALCRLALFPNVTIIITVSEPQDISSAVRIGRPTDCLPNLSQSDVVYTSGAPGMTENVSQIAKTAGAKCYADPFVSSASIAGPDKLVGRLIGWFQH
jgi:3-phenylpropionate/trans-cinnamate dioxygenase ferredoxin reductase subunit